MPTPLPGLKRVPRWRTMISPPVTVWPAKTFTPRRFALESRPLRLEPRPFLCAMGRLPLADRGDPDARELLAMAGAALVSALGLELEDPKFRAALVRDDLGLHGGGREPVALEERGIAVAGEQERLQLDGRAHVVGQALDEERLALDDAVLLTAGLDDCVGHGLGAQSVTSASAGAFARERRRPPLRPRRRVREDSASSSPSSSSSSGRSASSATSSRAATASSAEGSSSSARRRRRAAGLGTASVCSSAARLRARPLGSGRSSATPAPRP